ncbi:MAG: hypothetical protein HN878_00020 [Candidatus Diapherotrites archaeon]|jgi:hypothetical protein|nr:hypothetical protein [Candidatus Diapherotrites archaeon]
MPNKSSLEALDIPALEKRTKSATNTVRKNQENIERELNKVQGIKLPHNVLKRYEKEFGHRKVNFAFKTMLFAFAFVFFVLLFFQPSISIAQDGKEIVVRNNSGRTVENVNVQVIDNVSNIFDSEGQVFFAKELKGYEEVRLPATVENIYLARATRQMPSISFIIIPKSNPFEKNNNENDSDISNPLKKKLEEDKNAN